MHGQMKGMQVRITSLSFYNHPREEILALAEQELKLGTDMLVLPETWTGEGLTETLDSGTTAYFQERAKKYHAYIVNPVYRRDGQGRRLNTAVLIGREGEIQGMYHKYYPFWAEFDLSPVTEAGTEIPVFATDFGNVGFAICFDANFPEVWRRLSDADADIVIWPSAYSAGVSLLAHAINHNYYIVTATMCYDCAVYDITGRETLYRKKERGAPLVTHMTLDLNREIFHFNYNLEKRDRLLAEHPDEVELEQVFPREEWFVLKGKRGDVSVRELALACGMEPLPLYKRRSRIEIDRMRKPLNQRG